MDNRQDISAAMARFLACPEAVAELERVYALADQASANCRCLGGGCCCKFDLLGHRLYVTPAELALLTQPARPSPPAKRWRCAYQCGPRCTAYERRPLGCRLFFCSDVHPQDRAELCERLHGAIKTLHRTHCIPYTYAELTGWLDVI
jgi:hypothetical protein